MSRMFKHLLASMPLLPRFVWCCCLALSVSAGILAGTSAASAAIICGDLVNLKIAADDIGLPSGGASIASAHLQTIPADPGAPTLMREYCKVLGAIAPVDHAAPPIKFQVNLPLEWNGKAVQYGGGGSNGTLITGLAPLRDSRRDTPVPVARGFATWGTDAGHQNESLPEPFAFALNEESLINMAYASYKKTHDVGRQIASAFYGRSPSRVYFYGGSSGGREALMMAQRFPRDFDGIVSIVPVAHYAGIHLVRHRLAVLQQSGGWINAAKIKLIHRAVNAACDGLDGLADGVIGAYERCKFDPVTLRCPNGRDTGDACLSDAQIEADKLVHRQYEYPFPLAHDVRAFPGWSYGSEDQPGGMTDTVTGIEPPRFPITSARLQSVFWNFTNATVRYMFARNAAVNPFGFAAQDFAGRVREISDLFDTTDPDLSAFLGRGGKLILKGNGADYQRSVLQEVSYYKSVVAKMGQERADQFIRFYVTPGVNHGGEGQTSSGMAVPSDVDLLGALDGWVDAGRDPGTLTQVTQAGVAPFAVTASRPLCRYPAFPRYSGQGDPHAAASFKCSSE